MIERTHIFVDGQWVESAGADTITVINPSTEEPFATIPAGAKADVDRAATAAAAAFPAWSQTDPQERADAIRRVADILEARADEITRTIVSEVGQPRTQAEFGQTGTAIQDLRITADAVKEVDWDTMVGPTLVHRTAAGVVGAITPWNAPMKMIAMKAGAALAAGCTTVLKGTEIAPMSSFIWSGSRTPGREHRCSASCAGARLLAARPGSRTWLRTCWPTVTWSTPA